MDGHCSARLALSKGNRTGVEAERVHQSRAKLADRREERTAAGQKEDVAGPAEQPSHLHPRASAATEASQSGSSAKQRIA